MFLKMPYWVNPAPLIFRSIPSKIVGLVLLVAAFSKGTDIVRFGLQIEQLITSVVPTINFDLTTIGFSIAVGVLLIELLLGAMLVTGWKLERAARWTVVLFLLFIVIIIWEIARGSGADCGCFGALLRRSGWQALAEDLILIIILIPSTFSFSTPSSIVTSLRKFFAMALVVVGIIWMVIFHFNPPSWSALQPGTEWKFQPRIVVPMNTGYYVWFFSPNCQECQQLLPTITGLSSQKPLYAVTSATEGRVAEFELDFVPNFHIAITTQEEMERWGIPNGSLAYIVDKRIKAVLKAGQITNLEQLIQRMEQ